MTASTYRALSMICFLSAAVISILNLKRTINLGWKPHPIILLALGLIMFALYRRTVSAKQ